MITKKRLATILLFASVFLVFFAITGDTFAQNSTPSDTTYEPLAELPGIGEREGSNLALYLVAMFRLLIGAAAVLAVLMITIGGFQYMSTDAISGKSEGKEKINNALIGLFLAMGAWLILFTINPDLVRFSFNPPVPEAIIPGSPIGSGESTSTPAILHIYKYSYCHTLGISEPEISLVSNYPYINGNMNSRGYAENQCLTFSPQPGIEPASFRCTNFREYVCTDQQVNIPIPQSGPRWVKFNVCDSGSLVDEITPIGNFTTEVECQTSIPVVGPITPPRTGCATETIQCQYFSE